MPSSLDPLDVLDVANLLHYQHGDLDAAHWSRTEDARYRSSASRAYYAAFLRLKVRLLSARAWPTGFPAYGVHGKFLRALKGVFTPRHRIPMAYAHLIDCRELADYELEGSHSVELAQDLCDESEELIGLIDRLSQAKITDIANRCS